MWGGSSWKRAVTKTQLATALVQPVVGQAFGEIHLGLRFLARIMGPFSALDYLLRTPLPIGADAAKAIRRMMMHLIGKVRQHQVAVQGALATCNASCWC